MFLEVSVAFPHLGIYIEDLKKSVNLFGVEVAFYGIIIAIAIATGYCVAQYQAKRTGQDSELYLDFAMYVIVACIIGARLYYVIFSWEDYRYNLLQIFNLRAGGLGIYGAVITAIIVAIIYTRIKKMKFVTIADTGIAGLVVGQAIGRWGNFFNREAFGCYTDSLFAMQIKRSEVFASTLKNDPAYLENSVFIDGVEYIQAHPTFLYESAACFLILTVILLRTKKKKFEGELFCIYLAGYGTARFFIEMLRTDQLLLWNTNIPVSCLVSLVMAIGGYGTIIYHFIKRKKGIKENA